MSDIEEIIPERQDLPPSCSLSYRQLSQKTQPSTTSSSSDVRTLRLMISINKWQAAGLAITQEDDPGLPHQTVVTLHRQPSCVAAQKELTFKVIKLSFLDDGLEGDCGGWSWCGEDILHTSIYFQRVSPRLSRHCRSWLLNRLVRSSRGPSSCSPSALGYCRSREVHLDD